MNPSTTAKRSCLISLSTLTTPSRPPVPSSPLPPLSGGCTSVVSSVSTPLPADARQSPAMPTSSSCWQMQPTESQNYLSCSNNHLRNHHLPPNQQQRLQNPPPPSRPLLSASHRRNHDNRVATASSSMKSFAGESGCATKIEMTPASSSTSVNCFRCRGRRGVSGGCCADGSNDDNVHEVADGYGATGDVGKVSVVDLKDSDAEDWSTLDELRQLDIHGLRQLLQRSAARPRWKSDNENVLRHNQWCGQKQRKSSGSSGSCVTVIRRAVWMAMFVVCLLAFAYTAFDCVEIYTGSQQTHRDRWATVSESLLSSLRLSTVSRSATESSATPTGVRRRAQDSTSGQTGGGSLGAAGNARNLAAVTVCNLNPLRLTEMVKRKWPVQSRDSDHVMSTYSASWKSVNVSSLDVFSGAGHQLEKMVLSCGTGRRHCTAANFTTVATFLGNCFTIRPTANTLRLVLNAEGYEYTDYFRGIGRDSETGVRLFFHRPEDHPTLLVESISSALVFGGTHAHINIRVLNDVPSLSSCAKNAGIECVTSCRNDVIEKRCGCRPFWMTSSSSYRGSSSPRTCSMFQHIACVTPLVEEFIRPTIAFDRSLCRCLDNRHDDDDATWCRDHELVHGIDQSHTDLIPRRSTYADRFRRRSIGEIHATSAYGSPPNLHQQQQQPPIISGSAASAMTEARCSAADAASRTYAEIMHRDANEMSSFIGAVTDFTARSATATEHLRSARLEIADRVGNLRRRIEFHIRAALGGVRRTFDVGFAAAFDELRERSLAPLVTDCYETIADLERTVKQLSFTAASETIARKVLYHVADNKLSGKLETAIQSLDNLTRVYHAFVNRRPLPPSTSTTMLSSSALGSVSATRRYDPQLVPSALLSNVQESVRLHYAGMSENMAGLIDHLLALKSALKDVFQMSSSTSQLSSSGIGSGMASGGGGNDTEFELARRAYIRRVQHIRQSATLFQVEVIDVVRQSIDDRIDRCRHINRSLIDAASSLISGIVVQLAAVNFTSQSLTQSNAQHIPSSPFSTSSPLDRLQAFADTCGRYLIDASFRKSSIVVPDRSSTVIPLTKLTSEARRHNIELRRVWLRYVDAEQAVWNSLVGADEDLLRSFYLTLRADIGEMGLHPERADGLSALVRIAESDDVGKNPSEHFRSSISDVRPSIVPQEGAKSSTDHWYARLNADLPAVDVESTAARVSGELATLGQSSDFDVVIGGHDHVIVAAYDTLRANIEAVEIECHPSDYQELIRENVVIVDITQTGSRIRERQADGEVLPVYRLSTLLANLGGLLALFLGASAVTCFEIVDLISRFICGACVRRVRHRKSTRRKSSSSEAMVAATSGGSDTNHVLFRSVVDTNDDELETPITADGATSNHRNHVQYRGLQTTLPRASSMRRVQTSSPSSSSSTAANHIGAGTSGSSPATGGCPGLVMGGVPMTSPRPMTTSDNGGHVRATPSTTLVAVLLSETDI